MSGILMMFLLAVFSLIGLIMAVFPRRMMESLDRLEDRLFNRRPVKTAYGPGDSSAQPSRLNSIVVLSTRVVGIFTVVLGLFYIIMFVFLYPI